MATFGLLPTTDDLYQQITRNGTNELLDQLHRGDANHFNREILADFRQLANTHEFGIYTLLRFKGIFNLAVCRAYDDEMSKSNTANSTAASLANRNLLSYVQAISEYVNAAPMLLHRQLVHLLKMRIALPTIDTEPLGYAKINVKFPVQAVSYHTTAADITSILESQHMAISQAPKKRFVNTSQPNERVLMRGPVLTEIVRALINLQNTMRKNNQELSVNVKPFLQLDGWDKFK